MRLSINRPRPPWLTVLLPNPAGSPQAAPAFVTIVLAVLLAIPVGSYYQTVYQNAYNFPYEDDFNSALSFISEYAFGGLTVSEKLKLIFSQYNEHRIVFDRLVFLTDYALFSELNFRHLILIGNLSLVLIGVLFVKASFPNLTLRQKLVYLLPVAYSLFLFQYWELSTWSMAALQNLYVVAFAMLSLYSLSRPGQWAFGLACAAAVLAAFTSGNGIFTFLAGAPVLVLLKSYRKLAIWLLIGAATATLYFWGYMRPPYHPDVFDSLVNHTGRAVAYFFALSGAFFPNRPTFSVVFGAASLLVSLGLVAYLWRTNRLIHHLPMLGMLLFLYLTCLSLTAGRSGFGVQQAFSARYGIITVMLYACQAVLVIEVIANQSLRIAATLGYSLLAVLLFVSATNARHRREIEDRTARLRQLVAQYQANPNSVKLPWGDPAQAKAIFDDAVRRGIYRVEVR